jgi:hypothetical protein
VSSFCYDDNESIELRRRIVEIDRGGIRTERGGNNGTNTGRGMRERQIRSGTGWGIYERRT